MSRRKICIITGTRAEYGLFYWLMRELQDDNAVQLQVIATGMHLSPEFGCTGKRIEEDGFAVDAKVEMLLSSDTGVGLAKSIGVGVIGFADALDRLRPDIVVLLGDRFEALAAAQAAMAARIPIAHIHGGEATEGLIDEAIRHSLTKMAHLHFVAAAAYRRRVIQLGEDPERVFNFGAVGLDHIRRQKLLTREAFETAIGFRLGELCFLVTYHPVTLSKQSSCVPMAELLSACEAFPQARLIFTLPNADTGGRAVRQTLDEWAAAHADRCLVVSSLGQNLYLSALQHVDLVMGNSSSGLLEVPSFKKPTINVGDRQKGRLKATSVIDCKEDAAAIKEAVDRALSSTFQEQLNTVVSPYEAGGDVSRRVECVLRDFPLDGILMKTFRDLETA